MEIVTKDSESENPQEHPVHHHRHKLPVVFDLWKSKKPIVFGKYLTFAKKKDITTKTSQQRYHNEDFVYHRNKPFIRFNKDITTNTSQ